MANAEHFSTQNLRRRNEDLLEASQELCRAIVASGGGIYVSDFFFVAALNRASCLLRGFCDLIDSANFVTAAPLARLQLDTCLRTAAIFLVSDYEAFASEVLGGKQVRNLKDANDKCKRRLKRRTLPA